MEWILLLLVVAAVAAFAVVARRRVQARELTRSTEELAPVKKLAFEDITALGVDLQELDLELTGQEIDAGARSDYQRALDAYESAKVAGDASPGSTTSDTSPRSSKTVGMPSRACAPESPASRSRPAGPPASSTLGTGSRSPTWSSCRRTVSSGMCPHVPWTPSASVPAPTPTSAT